MPTCELFRVSVCLLPVNSRTVYLRGKCWLKEYKVLSATAGRMFAPFNVLQVGKLVSVQSVRLVLYGMRSVCARVYGYTLLAVSGPRIRRR